LDDFYLSLLQIRASDDYVPGSFEGLNQWHLGSSSILAHALDLAPFKVKGFSIREISED
jgi:hypothetical protein